MAYFPFYVELKDVSVLIVGGGKVALHKVKRILDYGPKIKVVAKKVDERIKNIKGVEWEEREFEDSDVEGVRFVIAAAGDEELDEHITSLCNDKGILINVVDVKDKCDFIFPSVVSRGKLEIVEFNAQNAAFVLSVMDDADVFDTDIFQGKNRSHGGNLTGFVGNVNGDCIRRF